MNQCQRYITTCCKKWKHKGIYTIHARLILAWIHRLRPNSFFLGGEENPAIPNRMRIDHTFQGIQIPRGHRLDDVLLVVTCWNIGGWEQEMSAISAPWITFMWWKQFHQPPMTGNGFYQPFMVMTWGVLLLYLTTLTPWSPHENSHVFAPRKLLQDLRPQGYSMLTSCRHPDLRLVYTVQFGIENNIHPFLHRCTVAL